MILKFCREREREEGVAGREGEERERRRVAGAGPTHLAKWDATLGEISAILSRSRRLLRNESNSA